MPVTRLRVAWRAVIRAPLRVRVCEQAGFAIRFGQRGIGTRGGRQVAEELDDLRVRGAVDRRRSETGERYDEAVELAAPVVHPVVAAIGNKYIQAVSAVSEVAGPGGRLRRRGVVGVGVQPAVGVQVVVELQVVVALAAEQPVVPRAAEQHVVARVAEDPVLAVLDQRARGAEAVEVQEEPGNLRARVVGVVERPLLPGDRIDPGVHRQIAVVLERVHDQ